jgi:hypothetical protein
MAPLWVSEIREASPKSGEAMKTQRVPKEVATGTNQYGKEKNLPHRDGFDRSENSQGKLFQMSPECHIHLGHFASAGNALYLEKFFTNGNSRTR